MERGLSHVGLRGNLGDEGAERGLALPDRGALTASGSPVTTAQMTQGGPCASVLTAGPWGFGGPGPRHLCPQAEPLPDQAPAARAPGLRVAPAPTVWVWLFQTEGGLEPTFSSEGLRPNAPRPPEVTQ